MKVITIASDPNFPGLQQLKRSLDYFKWDYEVIIMPFEFGRQMKTIYQWCCANWGWFAYSDAYDTFALSNAEELMSKLPKCEMLISAEKGCYPDSSLASKYPECKTEWKYCNGGGFITTCEFFKKIYEDGSHNTESNDQQWLSEQYLKRQDEIILNTKCDIFQTIAFEGEKDFAVKAGFLREPIRIINSQTRQAPIFIHGNGHTPMVRIYQLL